MVAFSNHENIQIPKPLNIAYFNILAVGVKLFFLKKNSIYAIANNYMEIF